MRALLPIVLLVGCAPSEGERAEAAYESARQSNVSGHERCRLAREAQYAYARDGDTRREESMRTIADMACLAAATCEDIPWKGGQTC